LEEQQIYNKIFSTPLMEEIDSVLTRLDGGIYEEEFEGDVKTATLFRAPEYVQEVINLRAQKT
jgi:hypothetical protein